MNMQQKIVRILLVLALGVATLGFIAGIQVANAGAFAQTPAIGQAAAVSWIIPGDLPITLPGGSDGIRPQVSWNG